MAINIAIKLLVQSQFIRVFRNILWADKLQIVDCRLNLINQNFYLVKLYNPHKHVHCQCLSGCIKLFMSSEYLK